MLHLCGTCHDRCSKGEIDRQAQILYKARLRERLSNVGPADPYRQTKHDADKKELKNMFEGVPRPVVERFLDVAEYEQIAIPCVAPLENLINVVCKPSFHLYDEELLKLVRDFVTDLSAALELSSVLFYDYGHNLQIASLRDYTGNVLDTRREEFRYHIALAKQGYSLLNSYVREQFPDLDLEECDRIGVAAFQSVQAESERLRVESRNRPAALNNAGDDHDA
jgi:hypothetical protein